MISSAIDIGWEGIPNWVSALTAFLTLGAAVFAGIYARKAAHSTKAQADSAKLQSASARQQAETAADHLAVAREDALLAREEAASQAAAGVEANRRLAESRLDAQLPRVFAQVTQGHLEERMDGGEWNLIRGDREISAGVVLVLKVTMKLTFENVSDEIAYIAILDPVQGEVEKGNAIFLRPRETQVRSWTRTISSYGLSTDEEVNMRDRAFMYLTFRVHDLGMNVHEDYSFNADLRYFTRDGSKLLISPTPAIPWDENIAVPTDRVYDRLDSAN